MRAIPVAQQPLCRWLCSMASPARCCLRACQLAVPQSSAHRPPAAAFNINWRLQCPANIFDTMAVPLHSCRLRTISYFLPRLCDTLKEWEAEIAQAAEFLKQGQELFEQHGECAPPPLAACRSRHTSALLWPFKTGAPSRRLQATKCRRCGSSRVHCQQLLAQRRRPPSQPTWSGSAWRMASPSLAWVPPAMWRCCRMASSP